MLEPYSNKKRKEIENLGLVITNGLSKGGEKVKKYNQAGVKKRKKERKINV